MPTASRPPPFSSYLDGLRSYATAAQQRRVVVAFSAGELRHLAPRQDGSWAASPYTTLFGQRNMPRRTARVFDDYLGIGRDAKQVIGGGR